MDTSSIWYAQGLLADLLLLAILLSGAFLVMACVGIGYLAIRAGEGRRAWGIASYALVVATPCALGVNGFGQPLLWPVALIYGFGLFCGFMALRRSYTFSPEWTHIREHGRRRSGE